MYEAISNWRIKRLRRRIVRLSNKHVSLVESRYRRKHRVSPSTTGEPFRGRYRAATLSGGLPPVSLRQGARTSKGSGLPKGGRG